MERIAVMGIPGSGKSTFSRRLGDVLNVPVTHLDSEFWEPGWEKPDSADWTETHREMTERESWILDGNYWSTLDSRLAAADTVVVLSVPRYVALYRVVKRWLTHDGETRPDMAEGCEEKVDAEFARYIWRFPEKMQRLERTLEAIDINVVRLGSNRERDTFLKRLRAE